MTLCAPNHRAGQSSFGGQRWASRAPISALPARHGEDTSPLPAVASLLSESESLHSATSSSRWPSQFRVGRRLCGSQQLKPQAAPHLLSTYRRASHSLPAGFPYAHELQPLVITVIPPLSAVCTLLALLTRINTWNQLCMVLTRNIDLPNLARACSHCRLVFFNVPTTLLHLHAFAFALPSRRTLLTSASPSERSFIRPLDAPCQSVLSKLILPRVPNV